jgi:hypothetical protein
VRPIVTGKALPRRRAGIVFLGHVVIGEADVFENERPDNHCRRAAPRLQAVIIVVL